MKKKVVLLVFVFCCICGINVLAKDAELDIDSKNTINKTSQVEVNIKSPEVKSSSKIVNSIFNEINSANKKWSDALIKEANTDQFDPMYVINSSFQVPYNANNLLSLNTMNYYYAGGAHGLNNLISYNYDTSSGKKLALKDMFIDGFDYKTLVNQKIKDYIAKDPNTYFSGGTEFKGIDDNQDFYFSNDGITVYFQVYKIAPYAAGIRYFLIPKAEIEQNLKVKF
ncbi:MAG: DUF3298 domain-containing protein [Sarcina sp.]